MAMTYSCYVSETIKVNSGMNRLPCDLPCDLIEKLPCPASTVINDAVIPINSDMMTLKILE